MRTHRGLPPPPHPTRAPQKNVFPLLGRRALQNNRSGRGIKIPVLKSHLGGFWSKNMPVRYFWTLFFVWKIIIWLVKDAKMGIWVKILAFGSKYWYLGQNIGYLGQNIGYLGQNIGIWVKIWDICLMSGPLYWIQPLC